MGALLTIIRRNPYIRTEPAEGRLDEKGSMSFAELGLSPELLKAVEEAGYNTPTPIQQQAIPVVLMGRDVLGVAQTGTGKTAGFTLPMIDILAGSRAKARMPRSLILAPTRELASQVAENFEKYGKYHRLTMAKLIGGESMGDQEKLLDRGVDVLIATPGRMMDLFDRGRILLNDVKILVIDEADRMLDMGFIPDIERIVSLLPKIRQTLFFSATMAPEIRRLADAFLMNPKEIAVAAQSSTATTVSQFLVICDEMDKREALRRLIALEDVKNAFIFCNRKRDVDILYRSLTKHGFDVVQLHGDMVQSARTETLDKFRKGEVRLMVCSDVAARGIDISNVSHVFNFDTPHHSEDYVHRIGRTGRAGKEGRAFTIATPDDGKFVAAIEKLIGNEVPRMPIEGIQTLELDMEGGDRRGRGRGRGKPAAKSSDRKSSSRTERPERAARPERTEQPEQRAERPAPVETIERPERQEQRPEQRPERQDRPERSARPERAERPDNRTDHRQDRPAERGPRRDDPRRNDRSRGRGRWDEEIGEFHHADNVIGFGDAVPDFMLVVPFPNGIPPLTPESDFEEEPVKAVAKPVNERRERRERRPARQPAATQVVETPAVATDSALLVETAPVEEAVAEKPKRARRAKAAPEAEQAKKPARARKPKTTAAEPTAEAQPEAAAVVAPAAEDAPAKPKRSRSRKKAAPEGDAA
jgi:superfamily II DNA/RNA helicase